MIKLLGSIPRNVTVACSGGVDSMAVLDFLKRNHQVTVAYFNHGTAHGNDAKDFIRSYCDKEGLPLLVGEIKGTKTKDQSQEEFWREERYKFLDMYGHVVTAHHLDDVAETWIWSCLHGTPSLIPRERNNVIRPFLINKKSVFEEWCRKKSVPFIVDPSNNETKYTRNFIRRELMPQALNVNPGLHTMLKKKLLDFYSV